MGDVFSLSLGVKENAPGKPERPMVHRNVKR